MDRRKFLIITGGTALAVAGTYYLLSDKSDFIREDNKINADGLTALTGDEKEILFLASLAPSGHNIQPWFVKYIEPYHWIICNDKNRWLPGVDPTRRETILSIGAFLQNLEYAADNLSYICEFNLMAASNQDENIYSE